MAFVDPKHNIAQLGLTPGMQVADFGAGAGYLAVEVAEVVGKGGRVYVIDIQQQLLTKVVHLAKEHHLDSLVYVRADLEAPQGSTLPEASVDVVLISNLLFQVQDKAAVLAEAKRILRPQGMALIVDWRDSFGGVGPQPEHVLYEPEARSLAAEAGFEVVRDIDAGEYHYGFIIRSHG